MKKRILLLITNLMLVPITNAKTTHKTHNTKSHKTHSTKENKFMHGVASFYSEGLDGEPMANGEIFDITDTAVAAHPTLPLGTKLKVTNTKNHKFLYVEIKDRMPKIGRVIDLTIAAAKDLDMYKKGLTQVSLKKVTNKEFYSNT